MLELGLVLVGQPADRIHVVDQLTETRTLAQVPRDSGYRYLVVGQHFLGAPYRYLQPVPLLANLVPDSGEMRLVTGILLLSLLHPVEAAEQLATLDVLSGGRLVFGVGLGYRETEMDAFGVSRANRRDRLLEALEIVRTLWHAGRIDYEGKYFQVRAEGASIKPLQEPEPPIWLAAMSSVTLQRAIRLGVVPYVGPRTTEGELRDWLVAYRESSNNSAATLPVRREFFIARRRATAWEEAERYLSERFALYREWGFERGQAGTSDHAIRSYLADRIVAGDESECAETLARYAEMGASPIILRCQWPSLGRERVQQMVELAGHAASLLR